MTESPDPSIDEMSDRLIRFLVGQLGECESCGSHEEVAFEPGRTAYHYEGEEETEDDPNRDVALCRPCAAQHHEHWDAMWAEYHNSQGW